MLLAVRAEIYCYVVYKADEVEALAAIYGDEWCVEDAVERRYSININDGSADTHNSIQLQVSYLYSRLTCELHSPVSCLTYLCSRLTCELHSPVSCLT